MQKFKIHCLIMAILFFAGSHAYAQQRSYTLDEDLLYRINFGRSEDIVRLLEQGANPNAVSSTGEYAITVAIGRDDSDSIAIVKALLDKGANPNIYDKNNEHPIVSAVVNNKTQIVADLLEKHADYKVKSVSGRTLIEIAHQNHNAEIEKMFQDRIDRESATAANLRTPERFKEIVHQYTFDSCAYQYWSFVLGSRQFPDKTQEIKAKADAIRAEISGLIAQIQKYYPTTPTASLQHVSDETSQQIYGILDAMISNSNRANNGVGTENDANTRCHKLSDGIEVNYIPAPQTTASPSPVPIR